MGGGGVPLRETPAQAPRSRGAAPHRPAAQLGMAWGPRMRRVASCRPVWCRCGGQGCARWHIARLGRCRCGGQACAERRRTGPRVGGVGARLALGGALPACVMSVWVPGSRWAAPDQPARCRYPRQGSAERCPAASCDAGVCTQATRGGTLRTTRGTSDGAAVGGSRARPWCSRPGRAREPPTAPRPGRARAPTALRTVGTANRHRRTYHVG